MEIIAYERRKPLVLRRLSQRSTLECAALSPIIKGFYRRATRRRPFAPELSMPTFFVNKDRVDISSSVPGDTPLLWILRDSLNLTGTKYGCGMALCGACTVLIEGQPARSCQILLSSIKTGTEITTIEGLKTKEAQAVQAAWEKLDVPQCGYCQSGQVVAAAALLAKTKRPTDADIDVAMAGNLCRCATYQRIRAAIKEASTSLG
jgi:isoquinoline 1-oxidoreductase alpha subunit